MSTKLSGLSISYKKGHLHVRLHMHSKYDLDMTGLPENTGAMHEEVARRIMSLGQPSAPEQKIAAGVDPVWIDRLAAVAIKEAKEAGELEIAEDERRFALPSRYVEGIPSWRKEEVQKSEDDNE